MEKFEFFSEKIESDKEDFQLDFKEAILDYRDDDNDFEEYYNSFDRTEKSEESEEYMELSDGFLEKFPDKRRDAVKSAFEHADKEYIDFIEKNKDALTIKKAGLFKNSGYLDNCIYMQRDLGYEEYGEVVTHELGHYLDERQGWYSENIDYLNAVYDDSVAYSYEMSSHNEKREEMLDELFSSDVCYNRHVSDILSAISRNHPEIVKRYYSENVSYYQHSNEYFARGHNRENEIYADMMACIAENDTETINFLKKYYPNIYRETVKSIEGVDNHESN